MLAKIVIEELMAKHTCIKESRIFNDRYYVDPITNKHGQYCQPYETIRTYDNKIWVGTIVFDLRAPNSIQELFAEVERLLLTRFTEQQLIDAMNFSYHD